VKVDPVGGGPGRRAARAVQVHDPLPTKKGFDILHQAVANMDSDNVMKK
jgi:hypothetical protein